MDRFFIPINAQMVPYVSDQSSIPQAFDDFEAMR